MESSANKAVVTDELTTAGRSLMNIEKRIGPRMEPCGTPERISPESE